MPSFTTKMTDFGGFEATLASMMVEELKAAQHRAAQQVVKRLRERTRTIKGFGPGQIPSKDGAFTGKEDLLKGFYVKYSGDNRMTVSVYNRTKYFKAVDLGTKTIGTVRTITAANGTTLNTVVGGIPVANLMQWLKDSGYYGSHNNNMKVIHAIRLKAARTGIKGRGILRPSWLNSVAAGIYKAEIQTAMLQAAQKIAIESIRTRGAGFIKRLGRVGTAAVRSTLDRFGMGF